MLPGLLIVGIFLSLILLISNYRRTPSAMFLGGFFFLVSLYGFIHYVLLFSNTVWLIAIVFINLGFLTYLTGPMLYWYVRSLLNDDSRFKKSDLLHFIPMILYLAGTFSYMITPWSYKLEVAGGLAGHSENILEFNSVGIYHLLPKILVFLSRPLLVLGYLFWSAFMFYRFIAGKKDSGVFFSQRFMIKWMMMLLGFLKILAISQILLMMKSFFDENLIMFYTLNSLQLLSAIGLTGLLISPFFFPEILYGLPRLPESARILTEVNQNVDNSVSEAKKLPPKFESEYLSVIEQKIDVCMNEFQPFLQPDFNLNQLSVLVHLPAHHLAYYFREVKKQSFHDYRNALRVNFAKSLILDGKARGMTLEAIGLLSGFSTRNTFFTSFKKVEGVSPGAFVAQNI